MQLNITEKGSAKGQLDVADGVFAADYNEALIHQVVVAQMAAERAGTKAQKNRSEKRGGGIKPWKQKGTGRARAGSIRSPIWRGGAKTFAAKPRDFSQKVNKKMFRGAMRSILSELVRQERLIVVEDLQVAEPKTKLLVEQLRELNVSNTLIVVSDADRNILLASSNLPSIAVIDAQGVEPLVLMSFEKVVITVAALKQLEERLS